MVRRPSYLLVWAALGLACSGEEAADSGVAVARDAAVDAGAASQDAGTADAAVTDAGATDSGVVDAGPQDSGIPVGEVRVANRQGACGALRVLYPGPGELGHWAGVRLTPPAYPFEVRSVDADLVTGRPTNGPDCVLNHEHRVGLWIIEGDVPEASPVFDRTLVVVGGGAIPAFDPLRLEAGQHLMVAVEMSGEGDTATCLHLCGSSRSEPNRNFWSNATAAPFSWAELSGFGITQNVEVSVIGEVVP